MSRQEEVHHKRIWTKECESQVDGRTWYLKCGTNPLKVNGNYFDIFSEKPDLVEKRCPDCFKEDA